MKIAYLIYSSEIGGTEKMLLLLAQKLRLLNCRILIITLKGQGTFPQVLKKNNFPVYILDIKKDILWPVKLIGILKKERPQILHSFLYVANLVGRLAGKISGIPIIVSAQRSTDPWRKWYHWKADCLTSFLSSIIVSNSYAGKNALIKKGHIPPAKIIVIENGIEQAENILPFKKSLLGIDENVFIVGTVGNLREPKGHSYFILAAPEILKNFPNTRFLILGQGHLKCDLESRIKKLSIEQNVTLAGFQQEPEKWIELFDVFVLPSLWEGFPVTLLEAMSLGKAIVATNVGDVPRIIENGKDGIVIPPADSKAIAQSVIQLLKKASMRKTLGNNAYNKFCSYYTCEKMVDRHIKLYKRLLKK